MILRRLFTLAVLAVAALLSLSDRAHATYDTSTSVASVTPVGGVFMSPLVQFPTATSFTDGGGLGTVTFTGFAKGYSDFVDQAGSTIYFVNQVAPMQSGVNGINESIYVSTPSGVTDNSTWTVNLLVSVANPTGSLPATNFGTGGIAETATFVMSSTVAGSGSYSPTALPTFSAPTTIIVGPNSFTLSSSGAAGGAFNQSTTNGAVSAAVFSTAIPEPASVVMLGSGLAGVIGLGLRRRKKQI